MDNLKDFIEDINISMEVINHKLNQLDDEINDLKVQDFLDHNPSGYRLSLKFAPFTMIEREGYQLYIEYVNNGKVIECPIGERLENLRHENFALNNLECAHNLEPLLYIKTAELDENILLITIYRNYYCSGNRKRYFCKFYLKSGTFETIKNPIDEINKQIGYLNTLGCYEIKLSKRQLRKYYNSDFDYNIKFYYKDIIYGNK